MRFIFTFLFTVGMLGAAAQPNCPPPFGKDHTVISRYHVTVGAGVNKLLGTLQDNTKLGHSLIGRVDYQLIRGLYVGLEGQFGVLRAEAADSTRAVKNNYLSAGASLTIHPFEIFLSSQFSNEILQRTLHAFYIGGGMKAVRNSYDMDASYNLDVYNHNDANGTWILPTLNAGFAVPIPNLKWTKAGYFSIIANAQLNYGSNENMDGFHAKQIVYQEDGSASTRLVEGKKDKYSLFYVGLRYSF